MTKREVETLQRELNEFTRERVENITPLRVDGKRGQLVNRRVRRVKFWLGYRHPIDAKVDTVFMRRLRHPAAKRYSDPNMIRRGQRRRVRQREAMKDNVKQGQATNGVVIFDGKPCDAVLAKHLRWARNDGWPGRLNSGWRSRPYSRGLCINMCGRPSCPGRCAGEASNHVGTGGAGALDVSAYDDFGRRMKRCPHSPRIFNALGARDPVHFSRSGR